MFLQLFIAYNLIECLPNLLVNSTIIIKEFSFPIIQLILNRKAPSENDRIQLGLIDLEDLFLKYLNPVWLFQWSFKNVEGYDPKDMIIENKNDEEHYYAGKIYNGIKKK